MSDRRWFDSQLAGALEIRLKRDRPAVWISQRRASRFRASLLDEPACYDAIRY